MLTDTSPSLSRRMSRRARERPDRRLWRNGAGRAITADAVTTVWVSSARSSARPRADCRIACVAVPGTSASDFQIASLHCARAASRK